MRQKKIERKAIYKLLDLLDATAKLCRLYGKHKYNENEYYCGLVTKIDTGFSPEDIDKATDKYTKALDEYLKESGAIKIYEAGPPDSYTLYYDPVTEMFVEYNFQIDENYIGFVDTPYGLLNEVSDVKKWIEDADIPEHVKKEVLKSLDAYI